MLNAIETLLVQNVMQYCPLENMGSAFFAKQDPYGQDKFELRQDQAVLKSVIRGEEKGYLLNISVAVATETAIHLTCSRFEQRTDKYLRSML